MMRTTIVAVAASVICAVLAGPALADHDGHHGRHGRGGWGHERYEHDRGWHGHGRRYYRSEPDVYYAPPVYSPPTYYPSPGIDLVLPFPHLRIR